MNRLPTATRIQLEAAERLGLSAEIIDPEYGFLFQLSSQDRRRTFFGGRSPLNDSVAAHLAGDKHYTSILLERAGVRSPRTERVLSPSHPARRDGPAAPESARRFAEELGLPVIVKPNRLSHGRGVQLVQDLDSVSAAIENVFSLDSIALVQAFVAGADVRLDFLDHEYLTGYERRALGVRGDGHATLDELFAQADPRLSDGERRRRLLEAEPLSGLLRERGLSVTSVLEDGAELALDTPIHNLNLTSTARLVETIPDELHAVCTAAGRALGLRHYGIDLRLSPEGPTVIEVNASPLLSQIYLMGHTEAALGAQARVLAAAFEIV